MNILITGGAGYIGGELAASLSQNRNVSKITIYDNLSRGNFNLFTGNKISGNKIEFLNGDILDSRQIKKAINGIDVIYHLAAKVSTPFANIDAHSYEQINHWGTAEIVYAVENSNVQQFIFMSSASVYGSSSETITEETIPRPDSYYGLSKERAEQHLRNLPAQTKKVILRCSNVYGFSPTMRFDAVINKFMFQAHFGKRISVDGTGSQIRSFIHVNKLTEIISQIPFSKLESGIYNLSDKSLAILEIIETMKSLYPNIECVFLNQHAAMHEQIIRPSPIIDTLIPTNNNNLLDELTKFKDSFSFSI